MAISGINSGVPSSVYQTNMQQVGGQASVANKKDIAPAETESTASALADEVMLTGDQVDSASDAFENASHVGLLGATADEDDAEVSDDTEVSNGYEVPAGNGEDADEGLMLPALTTPGELVVSGDGAADDELMLPALTTPGDLVPSGSGEVADDELMLPAPTTPGGVAVPDEGNQVSGTDDTPNAGGPNGPDNAKPSKEDMMADMKKAQEEREAWEKFMTEQIAQHQKHMAELLKILQDLQDFMFTTMQEVAKNQADAGHRCAQMWDECIRGPR